MHGEWRGVDSVGDSCLPLACPHGPGRSAANPSEASQLCAWPPGSRPTGVGDRFTGPRGSRGGARRHTGQRRVERVRNTARFPDFRLTRMLACMGSPGSGRRPERGRRDARARDRKPAKVDRAGDFHRESPGDGADVLGGLARVRSVPGAVADRSHRGPGVGVSTVQVTGFVRTGSRLKSPTSRRAAIRSTAS